MGAPREMPAQFPCWCRATYSWGGETKKDLGFIEGDLIEALNAGDGQWWMGRLRRDPRAIGLFPSNFVKVLEENFQPAPNSRQVSPMPPVSSAPAKSQSVFRKPFQAYEKLGPRGSINKNGDGSEKAPAVVEKKSNLRPFSSMRTAQAPQSTLKKQGSAIPVKEEPRIPETPPRRATRSRSPMPGAQIAPSRQSSYAPQYAGSPYGVSSPQTQYRPQSRAPSPQAQYRAPSPQPQYRAPSPAPSRGLSPLPSTYHDGSAYPQILPASRQPSPNPYQQQEHSFNASRAPSPAPSGYGREPSPAPYFGYDTGRRSASPLPYDDGEDMVPSSPPPPPPPAHRVPYQPSRAPSTAQRYEAYSPDRQGTRTPIPRSPGTEGVSHMTPSPLRDAMNDVMSSLHDMSMYQDSSMIEPESPTRHSAKKDVWSPDAYDLVRRESRAQSSLGFAPRSRHEPQPLETRTPSLPSSRDGPPQLETYVQRMERQLTHRPSRASISHEQPPAPPLKGTQYSTSSRPATASSQSSSSSNGRGLHSHQKHPNLKHRKSAFELGREALSRTYTTKTNATNSTDNSATSASTQATSKSLMSGYSAGGFSATSAGSLARRKFGLMGSQKGGSRRPFSVVDTRSNVDITSSARSLAASSVSGGSGPSYHESHASHNQPLKTPEADWMTANPMESAGVLGGLSAPKARKSGFFKKMIESAKTGAASARSTIGSASGSRPGSRAGSMSPVKTGFGGGGFGSSTAMERPASAFGGGNAARDMGLGGQGSVGGDWMQVRRDVNRSNSLSRRERDDRAERCEMLDIPAINPIDQLNELAEGGEGLDGLPIAEAMDFNTPNLALVDKSTRFIQSLPPMVTPAALAQSYLCRPHRSDVQRLRAIFTWVSERIAWEEDFDCQGQVDTRRVVQTKRGCSEEIAVLVRDLCAAVGLHAEVVRGYLKSPGEVLDLDTVARPNHWWNAVIVDGEWRILDCSLASPSNPRRSAYTSAGSHAAETYYFLAAPMQICCTHIPLLPEQQHIVPALPHSLLASLPCSCPAYFAHKLELADFNTSALHLEGLEMSHLHLTVPADIEVLATTSARAFATDADGDTFESGDTVTKSALCQPTWTGGRKVYTIKALLPGDEGAGTLNVYAGKRGLMHSATSNPHPLALALPLSHTGMNPPYEFLKRHPTPHAQRHDLYLAQPQCGRLVLNNTFVFCVRQHPSSLGRFTPDTWGAAGGSVSRPVSPNPGLYARPGSAMSMVSATALSTSSYSETGMTAAQQKPAKLAIQTPSQKIIRLTRKLDARAGGGDGYLDVEDAGLSTAWETIIKIGERGTWRGLVLADRSARWCVFAEWECT